MNTNDKTTAENSVPSRNIGSRIIMCLLAVALLLPLCANYSVYTPYRLPSAASWWGSLIALIASVAFIIFNRKKGWLSLPTPGKLAALLGMAFFLTLIT